MTYCAGIKRPLGVLLLTDTALTGEAPHTGPTSSFGELHERQREGFVWEGALKTVPLGPSTAAAYSGNVRVAVELLRHVKYFLAEEFRPEQALQRAASALGAAAARVKVLIAAWDSGPLLLSYNAHGSGCIVTHDNFLVEFGSLSEVLPPLVGSFADGLENLKLPDSRFLSALLAIMQIHGVHTPLMQAHVGGAMIGLWVDDKGVHWMPDTSYVLYQPEGEFVPENLGWISIAARWGAVGISSTVSGDHRILMSTVNTVDPTAWWAQNQLPLAEVLKSRQSKVFAFLSKESQVATIVELPDLDENPLVRVALRSPKEIVLSISDGLLQELHRRYPPAPPDALDVVLHYHVLNKNTLNS